MYMESISVKNRQGAGGVIVYESRPKFKHIFSAPYIDHQEEATFKSLIKIEKDMEDYWDWNI
jgi:hypothetical protein